MYFSRIVNVRRRGQRGPQFGVFTEVVFQDARMTLNWSLSMLPIFVANATLYLWPGCDR
jgi:hypothetical protein